MRGDRARPRQRRSGPPRRCRSRTRRSTASRAAARPGDLTRRRLLQFGVAGIASVYGAEGARLGVGLGVGRGGGRASTRTASCCSTWPAATTGSTRSSRTAPTTTAAYVDARAAIHRLQGAERGRPRRLDAPRRRRGRPAGLRQRDGLGRRRDNGDTHGLDTLYGDGTGAADLAVMPAVDALRYSLSHFDNSDIWFKASYDLNVKTGWLGRWIDSNGSTTNPLQAISIDTALSKSIRTAGNPVCAIPSLSSLGFTMNCRAASAAPASTRRCSALAGAAGGGAQRLPRARARDVRRGGRDAPALGRRGATYTPGAGYPNTGTLANAAAARRPPAGGEPRHADHHDPLGRLRHPQRPARQPGRRS